MAQRGVVRGPATDSEYRKSYAPDQPESPAHFGLQDRPYDRWLRRFLEHISVASSDKDKQLLQFLMDLPEIPKEEIYRLESMATNADQYVGLVCIRERPVH